MRLALIGVVPIAAALAADVQSGGAQESFFNARYCTQTTGSSPGSNGVPDCAFHTWQQCVESARGLACYCMENPNWRGPREQPTTRGKSSRRIR
jgi:Protein of unknown function (DUF3551)